jgi:hypothetical protein
MREKEQAVKSVIRVLIACIGIVILIPGIFSAQGTATELAGTWSGRTTSQSAKPYRVTVILDGTGSGFIEYPNRKCGGTLRFIGKNGNTSSYQESITHGKANCTVSGRVVLIPEGNALAFSWSAGDDKATATLTSTQSGQLTGCPDCDLALAKDIQACYGVGNTPGLQACLDKADEDSRTCQMSCRP